MDILQQGKGELIGWHSPDDARDWVRENKSRDLIDKVMTAKEAVSRFVRDGDFIASGGFGHVRVLMSIIYEIIRQKKKNLTMAGKTAVHDLDILIGAGCVDKAEVAYSFGHELRRLSRASKGKVEGGKCKVSAEISNAGYQWRFLAGMMGLSFINKTKELEFMSFNPGVKLADVKSNSSFDILMPDKVADSPVPSAEYMEVLRKEIDPAGIVLGK